MEFLPLELNSIFPKLGNLASAAVPVCFDRMKQQGRLLPGSKVLMASSGSGIVASFVGMSLEEGELHHIEGDLPWKRPGIVDRIIASHDYQG